MSFTFNLRHHYNLARPPRLAKLPHSSLIGKLMRKVAKSIGDQIEQVSTTPDEDEDEDHLGGSAAAAAAAAASSPEAALLAAVDELGLAEHEATWVRMVLVARGGVATPLNFV